MKYECSICGKSGVKLWRPETFIRPLICASCAEKRQSPRSSLNIQWSRKGKLKFPEGKLSKHMLEEMDQWTVSPEGLIPSFLGKDPFGNQLAMTDRLKVNLFYWGCDGDTIFIPAIPDKNGIYLSYDSMHRTGAIDLWRMFPTR